MIKTVEAIVDENGQVRLSEPLRLSRSQRALVTILDEAPAPHAHDTALQSEQSLAEGRNRPERESAFGSWIRRPTDAVQYIRQLRDEWER
jgi:hypothetical protein